MKTPARGKKLVLSPDDIEVPDTPNESDFTNCSSPFLDFTAPPGKMRRALKLQRQLSKQLSASRFPPIPTETPSRGIKRSLPTDDSDNYDGDIDDSDSEYASAKSFIDTTAPPTKKRRLAKTRVQQSFLGHFPITLATIASQGTQYSPSIDDSNRETSSSESAHDSSDSEPPAANPTWERGCCEISPPLTPTPPSQDINYNPSIDDSNVETSASESIHDNSDVFEYHATSPTWQSDWSEPPPPPTSSSSSPSPSPSPSPNYRPYLDDDDSNPSVNFRGCFLDMESYQPAFSFYDSGCDEPSPPPTPRLTALPNSGPFRLDLIPPLSISDDIIGEMQNVESTPETEELSGPEMERAMESILDQMDWDQLRCHVATNRTVKEYRRAVEKLLNDKVDETWANWLNSPLGRP